MTIRLYLDSAHLPSVIPLLSSGICYGVTTNPTMLARDGWQLETIGHLVRELNEAGAQEICLQTWGSTFAQMSANAAWIMGLADNIVVKVPATQAGFHLAAKITRAGHPVLLTAVYSMAQAITAGAIGVSYIAPYLGRISDEGLSGDRLVPAMQAAIASTPTKVLVASVRSPDAVVDMVTSGIEYITARPEVIEDCLVSELANAAAAGFENDWNNGNPAATRPRI